MGRLRTTSRLGLAGMVANSGNFGPIDREAGERARASTACVLDAAGTAKILQRAAGCTMHPARNPHGALGVDVQHAMRPGVTLRTNRHGSAPRCV